MDSPARASAPDSLVCGPSSRLRLERFSYRRDIASRRASTWEMKMLSFWEPGGRGCLRGVGRRGWLAVVEAFVVEAGEATEAGGDMREGRKPPALALGWFIEGRRVESVLLSEGWWRSPLRHVVEVDFCKRGKVWREHNLESRVPGWDSIWRVWKALSHPPMSL